MEERITLRLSDSDRLLLEAVAAVVGVSLSGWVRRSAVAAARDWLRQRGPAHQPEELEHVTEN